MQEGWNESLKENSYNIWCPLSPVGLSEYDMMSLFWFKTWWFGLKKQEEGERYSQAGSKLGYKNLLE